TEGNSDLSLTNGKALHLFAHHWRCASITPRIGAIVKNDSDGVTSACDTERSTLRIGLQLKL
ncbi:MAG: hypothetical protein ACKVHE_23995, partial [Planctomycetales bacterium]